MRRSRIVAVGIAALGAVVAVVVSQQVFPYHSPNHDEAVYLQQAAMLLDGELFLRPPVPESMRPWFFVDDGGRLYAKYAPVPAAVFALGELLVGSYRASLAAIACVNLYLTYAVVAEAFDRRTGVVAAAALLATPLFVVQSGVFLPYSTTFAFELLFALAYVRAARREHRGYAALAGTAIGIAFFSRPYTAVLFAAPFIVHALATLAVTSQRRLLVRHGLTGVFGLAFVAVALGYNALVTGDPLLFPYEAFAPGDGIGFGRRELLGYERVYTPELAFEATVANLRALAMRWFVAGPVGVLFLAVGLARFFGRTTLPDLSTFDDSQARIILVGLLVSVVAGEAYFWGILNVAGALDVPDDGLLHLLGPYYHFDLLLPGVAFAASGLLFSVGAVRSVANRRLDGPNPRVVGAATLLVLGLVTGSSVAVALEDPIETNAAIEERYERAYQPIEAADLDDALVFLPTPYGPWLNHPFQVLRNDPDYDGATVYAIDDGSTNFDVVEAFPDRTAYRYVYRGEWAPVAGRTVEADLRRVRSEVGRSVTATARFGVPDDARDVSIRLASGSGSAYYSVYGTPDELVTEIEITPTTIEMSGESISANGNGTVSIESREETIVEVYLDGAGASGFSYRVELLSRSDSDAVEVLTPYVEACRVPDRCGGGAAYLPDASRPGESADVVLSGSGNRSSTPTDTIDFAIAAPPESGSSVVSPSRSR